MLKELDNETLLYLGIILFILIFLIWAKSKNRKRNSSSFRKRYQEKKGEKKEK
ncbi:MAG TPA: hypothetical protein VFI78_02445 [Salinimicrobium sp.]|nr:hypothetical protein [Salinimicrobium sp.]